MEKFFLGAIIAFLLLLLIMVFKVFKGKTPYDKLNAFFSVTTLIIILLTMLGFTDNRQNMYIDIALSYATLSFVSSVILAKFATKRDGGKNKND